MGGLSPVETEAVGADAATGTPGSGDFHSWGRHRWHQHDVRRFPADFGAYEDVPKLFREHILPGHVPERPLLTPADTVVTLGSCFAEELREVLEKANFGSNLLWCPSGLNTTFALLDFVSWAVTGEATHRAFRYERSGRGEISEWQPAEDRAWYESQFHQGGAFVFTLGLAEVWVDRETDRVFWRGVPEHIYDENRHEFRLTTVADNVANLEEVVRLVRSVNVSAPIVLTLSPVPLLATFRPISCMTADCVSKSVLRVALDEVLAKNPEGVHYWPSFELVKWAGAAFDWRAYGQDARHPQRYLVQCIMDAFVESYYGEAVALEFRARLRQAGNDVVQPHRWRHDAARLRRLRRRVAGKIANQLRRIRGLVLRSVNT